MSYTPGYRPPLRPCEIPHCTRWDTKSVCNLHRMRARNGTRSCISWGCESIGRRDGWCPRHAPVVVPWAECRCGQWYIKHGNVHCRATWTPERKREYSRVYRRQRGVLDRELICVECASPFVSSWPKAHYCSQACSRRASHRRTRHTPVGRLRRRSAKRRADCRKRGATLVYPYSRDAVFDRDGWLCWLCERAVDATAVVPDHDAPTIDHVVPLSRGGADTVDNVRLAHFICNTRRGVRLVA